MEKIIELCPTIKRMDYQARFEAVIRMCIAHVVNGGEYKGFHQTAIEYLEGIK